MDQHERAIEMLLHFRIWEQGVKEEKPNGVVDAYTCQFVVKEKESNKMDKLKSDTSGWL